MLITTFFPKILIGNRQKSKCLAVNRERQPPPHLPIETLNTEPARLQSLPTH